MCDAPTRTPPGWAAYMNALRSLGERGHLGSIASAELVRAGKALAVTAFEVGADAMAAAAGERESVPSPMQLRAMARPNTPVPCRPGGHCERWARKMGGCIAGECHRPAPVLWSHDPAAAIGTADVTAEGVRLRAAGFDMLLPADGMTAEETPQQFWARRAREEIEANNKRWAEHCGTAGVGVRYGR